MTAYKCDAILVQGLESTVHYFAKYRWIDAFLWETRDGHRGNWGSGHGPNIIDRIQGGDPTVVEWFVDNWCEEVERLHQREVVAKTVNSSVVGCIKTDNQVGIVRLFWKPAQNLSE
jgi:hypothetical protein